MFNISLLSWWIQSIPRRPHSFIAARPFPLPPAISIYNPLRCNPQYFYHLLARNHALTPGQILLSSTLCPSSTSDVCVILRYSCHPLLSPKTTRVSLVPSTNNCNTSCQTCSLTLQSLHSLHVLPNLFISSSPLFRTFTHAPFYTFRHCHNYHSRCQPFCST